MTMEVILTTPLGTTTREIVNKEAKSFSVGRWNLWVMDQTHGHGTLNVRRSFLFRNTQPELPGDQLEAGDSVAYTLNKYRIKVTRTA